MMEERKKESGSFTRIGISLYRHKLLCYDPMADLSKLHPFLADI